MNFRLSSLSVAILLATSGVVSAATLDASSNDIVYDATEEITSIVASNGHSATVTGDDIAIVGNSVVTAVKGASKVVIGSAQTNKVSMDAAAHVFYNEGSSLEIHGKTIEMSTTGQLQETNRTALGGKTIVGGEETEVINVTTGGDAFVVLNGGAKLDVNAKSLNIDAGSTGFWVQNSTTAATDVATANINVDNLTIEAEDTGLVTMSQGKLFANSGNVYIRAKNVILTRGHAVTEINKDGTHKVQLDGDINFNYDHETSKTGVDADVFINLKGETSYWNGNTIVSYSKGAPSSADKLEVNNVHLGLSDGAQWTPSFIIDEESADGKSGTFYTALNILDFNGGVINLNNAAQKIEIDSLIGTGGTLNVAATVESGALNTAQIVVGTLSQAKLRAAGPSFEVMYTGVNADMVTEEMVKAAGSPITMADNPTAALPGATVNQTVTEGDIRGALTVATTYDANGDVADVSTSQTQNSKLDAFGSVNALSAMTWRHEMNSLSKRMGELRDAPAGVGTWARYYGSEMEYGAQSLTSKNNTIQMGSDYTIGDWKVGVAANYTDGESSYNNGSADSKNYGLAVYGTWFVPCGAYIDLIAKYSRLDNDFALNGMDGSYENNAFSVSAETGYRFEFMDGGLFVEPQVGVSYGRIMGDDFTSQNGVHIEQDDYDSLIGRMGVRTGFKFPKDKGLIYARVSGVYDFQGEMDAVASKNGLKQNITEDLGGAWLEFGVGANFNWTDNTYSYIDIERTNGGDVKENYRFNVGIRHTF